MTDYDMIVRLLEIDDDEDVDVSNWEGGFLQTIVRRYGKANDAVLHAARLSAKQRDAAERMIEKYQMRRT